MHRNQADATAEPKHAVPVRNYDADERWRRKPLTPAQVLVHDIRLEDRLPYNGPMLEARERFASKLVFDRSALTQSSDFIRAAKAANTPIEQQRFYQLETDYGWIRDLRLHFLQTGLDDDEAHAKCRWTHVSSKFPEYLPGFFYALTNDLNGISENMRVMDDAIERHTRYSKHGKHFAAFHQPIGPPDEVTGVQPALISCPWLDWSVTDKPPPLRFQVDRREGFQSSRSSAHPLRSILQYFYRLEDTADREKLQVFTKHKPWATDKDLDLQVRQWYGHYPSTLVVDELWILIVDALNIVTFSSNVTWKSRWPPLQLSSRIADVSFRSIRNTFRRSRHEQTREYTAATHAIACLSGAVGMMHRNFWPDMPLCLTDRYAGYLGHLQYRLHRAPSTKLVMHLISCFDELNIVIQISQHQLDLISSLQNTLDPTNAESMRPVEHVRSRRPLSSSAYAWEYTPTNITGVRETPTYSSNISSSNLNDPLAQVIDNLQREFTDLEDLRDNTNALVMRTIQLVNIRLEDNGKSILVFTVVTIVFLPLNFIASFFGMNVTDIRNLDQSQSLFWLVAMCVTAGVVAVSLLFAFQGGNIVESVMLWRDKRKELRRSTVSERRQPDAGGEGFRVRRPVRTNTFGA